MNEFDREPYPGRPKVLFIGWPETPHTHRWVDLLRDSPFNVRVFCLNSTQPPDEWWPRCYVSVPGGAESGHRRTVFPQTDCATLADALVRVMTLWRPDIVHTLGIEPASTLVYELRRSHPEFDFWRWIVQARGGPELALFRFDPDREKAIRDVVASCDHFIADNQQNYEYVDSIGVAPEKVNSPRMGVVPGPGGLDLEELRSHWTLLPSKRERVIVWPKAYEINSAKAMPVFEAILKVWRQIQPCQIEMLWMVQPEVQMWYRRLFSPEMQQLCVPHLRLSHLDTLGHFAKARVMLAPSLLDGVPNAMMEAMALGAVPIVSPLETLAPVVTGDENVLFARNLYPDEIASAILRAMSDDELVDRIAINNLTHIRKLADRGAIRRRALGYYEEVAYLARAGRIAYSGGRTSMNHGFYFRGEEVSHLITEADPGSVTEAGDRIEMRVDGSGHAWIGTSGQCREEHRVGIGISAATDTGMVKKLYFRTGGANRVAVTPDGCEVNGSVSATRGYMQLADARLVKESTPIANAIAIVKQLTGKRFSWHSPEARELGGDLHLSTWSPQLGFIAQEVEQVLPEATACADQFAPSYVNIGAIVPVLVEALKAQQIIIDELSCKVQALTAGQAGISEPAAAVTEPA